MEIKTVASDLESYYSGVNSRSRPLSMYPNAKRKQSSVIDNFYRLTSTILPQSVKRWLLIGGIFTLAIIAGSIFVAVFVSDGELSPKGNN